MRVQVSGPLIQRQICSWSEDQLISCLKWLVTVISKTQKHCVCIGEW